ncbi:MAG: DNA-binding protein [Candidatus Hadarchaeum sp.]|uniref:DNA-binding protein n=1 Tax=Candidatus Hadarchaeum sp. TaxID=2883567 RepID=UPI003D0AB3FA
MKRALALILLLLLLVPTARAETLKELIDDPMAFDGKQVSFRGEVIGVMVRGEQAWINIFDNGLAIGIWCRAEEAREISYIGDYTHQGDIVAGVGIYHLACPEHGGDTDIHALSLSVVEKGHTVERPPDMLLVLLSLVIALAAVILSYYLWHIRKEMGKRTPWPFY